MLAASNILGTLIGLLAAFGPNAIADQQLVTLDIPPPKHYAAGSSWVPQISSRQQWPLVGNEKPVAPINNVIVINLQRQAICCSKSALRSHVRCFACLQGQPPGLHVGEAELPKTQQRALLQDKYPVDVVLPQQQTPPAQGGVAEGASSPKLLSVALHRMHLFPPQPNTIRQLTEAEKWEAAQQDVLQEPEEVGVVILQFSRPVLAGPARQAVWLLLA